MQSALARMSRGIRLWTVLALVGVALAACGGGSSGDDGPTPTAMPMSQVQTATVEATATQPAANVAASPAASPSGSPSASPIASGWTKSITRSDFEQQLLAAYPMEAAANTGGTIVLGGSSDISTLNPILVRDTLSAQVTGSIYESLVGASPIDGQIVPALADYWEVSADGLTYRFHISTTARWHDGQDVTAEDVKFSFDAALSPNTGSAYTTVLNENIASYRVIDADTIEVIARDLFVSFLTNGPGGIAIVPEHIWEGIPLDAWSFDGGSTGQDASRVVGSGPFKFKEWVQGDHVTLERNDAYYNGAPNLAGVVFRVLPDTDGAVLALESGETDVLEIIPAADTERIQNTDGLSVDIYDIFTMTLYMMNLDPEDTELFQEVEVRQALMMGLDRESITENIFLGFGEAGAGTQPPSSPAYAPDQMTPSLAFDPAAATELLASIGWKDTNGDGWLDRGGEKLKFDLIYQSGDATVDSILSYMQEAWKNIGVDANLEAISSDLLLQRLEDHDFDMAFLAFNLSSDGDQGLLFRCDQIENGLNFSSYCNPAWDALDELQKREFDSAARNQQLIDQSQIIWEDEPVGVIRFGVARTGYSDSIHNFYPNGYGFLWSLPYMWVDG
ncbi:peptide-binding protein [soil metagenome]